jgi:hypothetical protein
VLLPSTVLLLSTLALEAACFSEMMLHMYQTAWRYKHLDIGLFYVLYLICMTVSKLPIGFQKEIQF